MQPAAPAPAPAAKTPEQIAAEAKAASDAAAAESAKQFDGLVKQYALPDDLAARLATEPEQVLPFLAAKVHQHVEQQIVNKILSQIPQQIRNHLEGDRRNEEAKSAFYKAWPSLNFAEHHDKVMMVGQLFRQMNPNATAEQAIERIGQVVHAALGIPLPSRGNGQGTPSAGAVAQVAAPRPGPQPFIPAGGSGGRAATPAEANLFTELAEAMLSDDSV